MRRSKTGKVFRPQPRPCTPDPSKAEREGKRRCCIRAIIVTSVAFAVLAAVLTVFASGVVPEQYLAPLRAIPAFNVTDVAVLAEIASFASDAAKWSGAVSDQPDSPGVTAARQGLRAKHPVVFVPGFVTTGLELWRGRECAKRYFRQRMWGTFTMLESMILRGSCWMEHLSLNATTGLDPDGIKLRPAAGLEAVDFLIGPFWVLGKIIEGLGDIGHDSNEIGVVGHDWRMAFDRNQIRDAMFSKLRHTIELSVQTTNRKVVVVSHSMGGQVVLYFIHWVSHEAGPKWLDDHVHAFVSLATPWLGVPKAVGALLSGEMRDTAHLGILGPLVDRFFGPADRASLFRTWGSLGALFPKGGDAIWGGANGSGAPDDVPSVLAKNRTFARMVAFSDSSDGSGLTVDGVLSRLLGSGEWAKSTLGWMNHGDGGGARPLPHEECPKESWANPLLCALPRSNVTIYCMYGYGKPTERSYVYRSASGLIDTSVTDADSELFNGVQEADGDGTVPLLSLGAMCIDAWKRPEYNPGPMKIVTREYRHAPTGPLDPRGGPATADHVDLLGNYKLIGDVLHIVAGEELGDDVTSDAQKIAAKVPFFGSGRKIL